MPIPQLKLQKTWKNSQDGKKTSVPAKKHRLLASIIYGKRKNLKKNLLKTLGLATLGFLLVGSLTLLSVFAWFSRDLPNPDKVIERSIAQSTQIYERTGKELLYDVHGEKRRTLIELEEIPPYVKWATIVIEDKDFYTHHGFDFSGIIRAFLVDLLKGKLAQGGSTITQQFIKNAILTPEKTYTRKIKELVLAYQMEKKFSKDEILKMYLNEIPYGSNAYGLESASQVYFDKHASELTLAQAALLASLPKAPTYFSPYGSRLEELINRQHHILDLMARLEHISQEEAEKAKKEKLEFKPKRERIIAPHFVMYVKELLSHKYGEEMVEQGGLRVITSLDLEKQKIAEEAIQEGCERNKKSGASNASLVALDPRTGQILAMVGSCDWFNEEIDGQVNVSLRPRQPGSSFKPVVYGAAFKKGYTPETVLFDLVTTFKTPTGDYTPHNYDNKEHGPVTIRKALAGSLNIPAVKTLYLTGLDRVLDLAQEMGYTTFKDRSRFGLSLVLGGGEVKLLEHTAMFGILAQEGIRHIITPILKVEDSSGKILEEYQDQASRVLDKETTLRLTDILKDNEARSFIFGSRNYLILGARPVAAKTGTTDDFRDGWSLGYTPSLVAGVWVGNNDNTPMARGSDGVRVAGPIWNKFIKEAVKDTPIEYFNKPPSQKVDKPVLADQIGSENKVKIDKASGKLATEFTPESFIEEKTYREVHNILHYVDKNNPRGSPPEHPEKDPHYSSWEEAVQRWAREQNFMTEKPPQEYDDLHIPENKPTISILSPKDGETVNQDLLLVKVETKAPRGVKRVEYLVDEKLLETNSLSPFTGRLILSQFPNGPHILKVRAYDDIDNIAEKEIEFTLNFNPKSPETPEPGQKEKLTVSWLYPKSGSLLGASDFPLTLSVLISEPEKTERLDFYYQDPEGNQRLISSLVNQQETTLVATWSKMPQAGSYRLYATLLNKENLLIKTEEAVVEIK